MFGNYPHSIRPIHWRHFTPSSYTLHQSTLGSPSLGCTAGKYVNVKEWVLIKLYTIYSRDILLECMVFAWYILLIVNDLFYLNTLSCDTAFTQSLTTQEKIGFTYFLQCCFYFWVYSHAHLVTFICTRLLLAAERLLEPLMVRCIM